MNLFYLHLCVAKCFRDHLHFLLLIQAEKNEIREEKLKLKADKYRMEQQLKTMNIPATRFTAAPPAVYQAEVNKVRMLPSYGFVPMWQYLSPSVRDTSQDDKLRPPAA